MSERSILRLREHPHMLKERASDFIVEVIRDGQVRATIYGSREGLQIVSEQVGVGRNIPFAFFAGPTPSVIVPLLTEREQCPWCLGSRKLSEGLECPVCRKDE